MTSARAAVEASVLAAVRTQSSIAGATIASLLPDLPSGGPLQTDRSSVADGVEIPEGVGLVDIDSAEGPVLRFLEPAGEGQLRVQLLMAFPDVEPLPLGEMIVDYDRATGQPTRAVGLAY